MANLALPTTRKHTKRRSALSSPKCSSDACVPTDEAGMRASQNRSWKNCGHDCRVCADDMAWCRVYREIQLSFNARPASNGALPNAREKLRTLESVRNGVAADIAARDSMSAHLIFGGCRTIKKAYRADMRNVDSAQ